MLIVDQSIMAVLGLIFHPREVPLRSELRGPLDKLILQRIMASLEAGSCLKGHSEASVRVALSTSCTSSLASAVTRRALFKPPSIAKGAFESVMNAGSLADRAPEWPRSRALTECAYSGQRNAGGSDQRERREYQATACHFSLFHLCVCFLLFSFLP